MTKKRRPLLRNKLLNNHQEKRLMHEIQGGNLGQSDTSSKHALGEAGSLQGLGIDDQVLETRQRPAKGTATAAARRAQAFGDFKL